MVPEGEVGIGRVNRRDIDRGARMYGKGWRERMKGRNEGKERRKDIRRQNEGMGRNEGEK